MELSQVTFRDKLLPSQPILRRHFDGEEDAFYAALSEALERYSGLRLPAEEFQLQTSDQISTELMSSTPLQLHLLQLLVRLKHPRRILEIGTFIGLSALYMARLLPEDGRLVTIEKHTHCADLARQNFLQNRLDHKIHLIVGDAFDVLKRFDRAQRFDMAFLDGNKERYHEYFSVLDPLLLPQGLLVADDVLSDGDILNPSPKTEKGLGVKTFLEVVETRSDYQKVLLPVGNGMMLMIKHA